MQLFRYRADRLPVLLFVTYFMVDVAAYFLIADAWLAVGWMLLGIAPKACISSFGHHHQHLNTFRQPVLNRLLEVIYGFQTGVTGYAWFLHHVIGHHKHYLDQGRDESRWRRRDGSRMGAVEYSLNVALTGYYRAFRAGRVLPRQRRAFVLMLLLQLALLAALFLHNWVNALFIFLLPMAISLYITAWHTYYHHAGLDTDDPLCASYNLLQPWYNRVTGNLGYHTAHHHRGALHWSLLPELHEQLAAGIPPELCRPPFFPFTLVEPE